MNSKAVIDIINDESIHDPTVISLYVCRLRSIILPNDRHPGFEKTRKAPIKNPPRSSKQNKFSKQTG